MQTLNDLPIKQVNGAMVYIRDVANVRDGFAVQTNIVAQNRVRYVTLLRPEQPAAAVVVKKAI